MNFAGDMNRYQDAAGRTEMLWVDTPAGQRERILYHAMKMAGEAGEICDALAKERTGKRRDEAHLIEELGDLLWHVSRFADSLGVTLGTVASRNLDKLAARHGDAFSAGHYLVMD